MIFQKYLFVKKELVIILVGITLAGIVLATFVISNLKSETPAISEIINVDNQTSVETKINLDIQEKYDKVKNNTQNGYSVKEREWQTSGPFQIDRKEYSIGEKVFIVIGGIKSSEKGQIAVLRPLNATHYTVYMTIPFDGSEKNEFNYYIEPKISKIKNICSYDELIGKWAIVFRGTDYPNINFEIIPGPEVPGTFIKPVC